MTAKINYWWYLAEKENARTGEITRKPASNPHCLWAYLHAEGFRTLMPRGSNLIENSEYIRIIDDTHCKGRKVILRYSEPTMRAYVYDQIKQVPESEYKRLDTNADAIADLYQNTAKRWMSSNTTKEHLERVEQTDLQRGRADRIYFNFRNCTIMVTEDGWFQTNDFGGYIFLDWIKQHDIIDVDNLDYEGQFYMFTRATCTEPKTNTFDEQRFLALKQCIGYLLHNYRDVNRFSVAFTEANLGDGSNGRTGKGLIMQAIKQLRSVRVIDGKNFDFKDKFCFHEVQIFDDIIFLDDVNKHFRFESLYSLLSENFIVKRKQQSDLVISQEFAPKVVITTNYTVGDASGSDRARRFDMELLRFFSDNFTPLDYLRERNNQNAFFSINWAESEWQKFFRFMFECSIEWLKWQRMPSHNSDIVAYRRLVNNTSEDFAEYAKENFKTGIEYNYKTITDDMIDISGDKTVNGRKVSVWVGHYAAYRGWDVVKLGVKRNDSGAAQRTFKFTLKDEMLNNRLSYNEIKEDVF